MSTTSTKSQVFHRDFSAKQIRMARGLGSTVWDVDGNEYLDASSGASVVISIGYGVQEVLDAMAKQASQIAYHAAFTSDAQEELAVRLAEFAPPTLDYVRFTSGGSEANETAIKLARHYHVENGTPSKYKIVSRWRSYHGNTLGALSATGHVLRRAEYVPMLAPATHAQPPYRYRCNFCSLQAACTLECADDVERMILNEGPENVAAFICEPVVGAAAMGMVPDKDYFRRVREICDKYDVLLILDEVLSGMGRTGRNFAIDHWGVIPDMITSGKGIGSGYTPLGAVMIAKKIHDVVDAGSRTFEHGFTYGGNPLSSAVGLAVLDYITKHELVQRADSVGGYLKRSLIEAIGDHPNVGDIDGLGMLLGIEMVADRASKAPFPRELSLTKRIAGRCAQAGVLIAPSFSGNVDGYRGDRFGVCPPFVFTEAEVDRTVDVLATAIDEVCREVA